ncbi:MAG: iron-sulfur cluster assembly scaffold protein [Patescibacteria group bacterium]
MEDTIYKEIILELNRHPLNKKLLLDFDVEAREFNPLCGDDITVRIKFDKEGRVLGIGHQGIGCAISTAAVSLVTNDVNGKDKNTIRQMNLKDVTDLLGTEIIPTRVQCALLGLRAIQKCI